MCVAAEVNDNWDELVMKQILLFPLVTYTLWLTFYLVLKGMIRLSPNYLLRMIKIQQYNLSEINYNPLKSKDIFQSNTIILQ